MDKKFDDIISDAAQRAKEMKGWDFSYVAGRRHTDRHPWDYGRTVRSMLAGANDMLDMETGGGEILRGIWNQANTWPARVQATEGYKPNVAVAKENLETIGVKVVECSTKGRLPFESGLFDLITNRHGDFQASEVFRLLKPGGVFITQQIQFADKVPVNRVLGGPGPEYGRASYDEVASDIEGAGFKIEHRQEFHGRDIFYDVGALVFVLTAAPWELPGFSVARYRDRLYDLHLSIQSTGPLDLGIGFLLVAARKPV